MNDLEDNLLQSMVRESFDALKPPEGLNERTLAAIENQRELRVAENETKKVRVHVHRRLVYALAACLVLVAIGVFGSWWCLVPTAYVAIDVNPSIELSVNRFDYVVGERAVNDDGAALLDELSVVGEPFPIAIEKLVTSEAFAPYTTPESYVEVNISCNDESQTIKLEEASTASLDTLPCHSSCHAADSAEWEAAQAAGMGLGRYRAVQELLALDPALTLEDCDEMSMREIRDRITAITGVPYTEQDTGHHNESHESSDGEEADHHSEGSATSVAEDHESDSNDLSSAENNSTASGEHHGQGARNSSSGTGGHHGYMGGSNSSSHHD